MEAGVLQASRRRERLQLRRIRVAICGDARLCGTVLLSCACPLEKFLCSFLSSTLYHMVGYSFSDTPPDKSGGFLVRPGDLLRAEARQQSSGPLSPSVSHPRRGVGSPIPSGTPQGFR